MIQKLKKPKCRLTEEDGNAFTILGRVSRAMKQAGQGHLVAEMTRKATAGDYDHLLTTVQEYVEDVGTEDDEI